MPMSEHVAMLRAAVGTAMLHLPSIAAICHDDAGRVLLVREIDSGKWSTPGGVIEPGESPEESVCRELREETGAEVRVEKLLGAVGGPEFQKTYSNGDRLSFVSLIYQVTIIGGELVADGEETSDVGWFTSEELDELPKEAFLQSLRARSFV
jgi:ADP-ribose pyrophosphatase YjhB (NUDIX family)